MSEPLHDVAAFFNQSIRVAGDGEQVPPGFIEAKADLGDGNLTRLLIPAHLIPAIRVAGPYSVRKEGPGDVADVDAGS
jgi:hypothetical protein